MAKVSPVSIKYMIHANFVAEGLLGADLEMRELQKEGKIGRIEVDLERNDKRTLGKIKVPTALDQSETTLIAAAIETIERIGPSDAQIEVERIEDVRGSKRDYILERAKKLMTEIQGSTDSRSISNEIKESAKIANIQEYGDEKLPCGDLTDRELIVVEGRADVVNLLRNGVNNVIAMNGTKLPEGVRELSKNKIVTLFVDGDRGGQLIIQNVTENARVQYIAIAPDGKEVEELAGKEILMNLRKRVPVEEYLSRNRISRRSFNEEPVKKEISENKAVNLREENKLKLKKLSQDNEGSGKALFLNSDLDITDEVSVRSLGNALRRNNEKPSIMIIDGTVTGSIIKS